jgi:NADH:ubiquinone oxidoreductase subunit 6 (subunit J)
MLATALINWDALWKIALAAFVGGVGVVLAFGVLLLGISRAQAAKSEGKRLTYFALSTVCGLLCLGAVAIGIYAMVEKPVSKKPAATKSALVTRAPTATAPRLTASGP